MYNKICMHVTFFQRNIDMNLLKDLYKCLFSKIFLQRHLIYYNYTSTLIPHQK